MKNGIRKYLFITAGLLVAALTQVSPAIAGNLIVEDSSFETERLPQISRSVTGVLETAIDPTTSVDGKNSLRLCFAGGWSRGTTVFTEPGKTYTFSLYARAEKDEVKGSLLLVNPGWKHTNSKQILINKEWKRYSITITAKEKGYWLGFHAPGNVVWIDAVQFEEGELTPYNNSKQAGFGIYCPSSYYNLFLWGEKIPISICYYNKEEVKTKKLTLFYKISDFNGKVVKEETQSITLDKDGRFEKSLSFKPKELGLFTCRAQIRKHGVIVREAELTTFAVVKPPVKIKEGIEPFCGMVDRSISEDISEKLSFPWMEFQIDWKQVAPKKGTFHWLSTPFSLKKKGFKVKLIFWSSPRWSWDKEELAECEAKGIRISRNGLFPRPEEWRYLIREAALHYKDAVDIWEIWGEVDLTMGVHSPYYKKKYPEAIKGNYVLGPVTDRYAELVTIAAREIKSIIPDAKIGAIRPAGNDSINYSNPDNNFIFSREVFKKCGKEFNMFPLDPYLRGRYIGPACLHETPIEKLFEIFDQALDLGRKYGCNQPVYVAEMGWALDINAAPDSKYAKKHVDKLTKLFLISRMAKEVKLCMWHTLRSRREWDGRYDYGLWHYKGYPQALVPAYSTVSRIVENVTESKRIDLGPDITCGVFRKPDGADACIWVNGEKADVTVSTSPGSLSIFDVMGNPVDTQVKGKTITFEIGELPVYLSKKGKRAFKELCQILSSAKCRITPVDVSFNMPGIEKGILYLKNRTSKALTANIDLYLPENKTLRKSGIKIPVSTVVNFELPGSLVRNRGKEIKIEVDCQGFEKVITYFPLEWEECKKITFPVSIDGDLSEWSSHPCIIMNRSEQIYPMESSTPWSGPEDLSAKVYVGWDEKNFYMACEVIDDKHYNNKEGIGIWNGDCIQFAFDPWLNAFQKEEHGYDADDYEMGIALAKGKSSCYLWAGSDKELWKKSEFIVIRDENKKKTFYEARIPFSSLHILAKKGETLFGFSFVIFDDDEGAGQSYYYYLSRGIAGGKYPRYFKRFVLVE